MSIFNTSLFQCGCFVFKVFTFLTCLNVSMFMFDDYVSMFMHIHVYVRACTCMYVRVRVCVCVYAYAYVMFIDLWLMFDSIDCVVLFQSVCTSTMFN